MKKVILSVLLLLVCTSILFGCGSGDELSNDYVEEGCFHMIDDWGICTYCGEVTSSCKILGRWEVNGASVNGNWKSLDTGYVIFYEDMTYEWMVESGKVYTGEWKTWEKDDSSRGYTLMSNGIESYRVLYRMGIDDVSIHTMGGIDMFYLFKK